MMVHFKLFRRQCRRVIRSFLAKHVIDDEPELPKRRTEKVVSLADYPTQRAVRELYWWCRDQEKSNFSALLYTLIAKADNANLARLEKGFPEFVAAFREWHETDDIVEFFKRHGVDFKELRK